MCVRAETHTLHDELIKATQHTPQQFTKSELSEVAFYANSTKAYNQDCLAHSAAHTCIKIRQRHKIVAN